MPATSAATITNSDSRVSTTVIQTPRNPTSPNHNQFVYISISGGPTNSRTNDANATISHTRARRDNNG